MYSDRFVINDIQANLIMYQIVGKIECCLVNQPRVKERNSVDIKFGLLVRMIYITLIWVNYFKKMTQAPSIQIQVGQSQRFLCAIGGLSSCPCSETCNSCSLRINSSLVPWLVQDIGLSVTCGVQSLEGSLCQCVVECVCRIFFDEKRFLFL